MCLCTNLAVNTAVIKALPAQPCFTGNIVISIIKMLNLPSQSKRLPNDAPPMCGDDNAANLVMPTCTRQLLRHSSEYETLSIAAMRLLNGQQNRSMFPALKQHGGCWEAMGGLLSYMWTPSPQAQPCCRGTKNKQARNTLN